LKNHFFKTLVFTPAVNFKPETQYLVKLENIKSFGLKEALSFLLLLKLSQHLNLL